MNVKKIMAITAVILLATPAFAAANGAFDQPVQAQVVEGHTVFVVIEHVHDNQTEEQLQAAAVAVLVREREDENRGLRFTNGVLWFNDQYLVSPDRDARNTKARYPCGGAVIATNANAPDPRTFLATYNDTNERSDLWMDGTRATRDTLRGDDYAIEEFLENTDAPPESETRDGAGSGSGTGQPERNSWVDVSDPDGIGNPGGPVGDGQWGRVSTSATTTFAYNESYLITDPNDHTWIIDKYDMIRFDAFNVDTGSDRTSESRFPLWVVNILGKPTFTPDDNLGSCTAYVDDPWQQGAMNAGYHRADTSACDTTRSPVFPDTCPSSGPGFGEDGESENGVPTDGMDARPASIGYYEPTDEDANGNRYCYDGNRYEGDRPSGSACDHGDTWMAPGPGEGVYYNNLDVADRNVNHPLRLYNALLFFFLGPEDIVYDPADARGHDGDTNGCWPGTEWKCPDGNHTRQGNSHPFNPRGVYVPGHVDPATGNYTEGGWVDVHANNRLCSNGREPGRTGCPDGEHETHNRADVRVYYSPSARPMDPPVREFRITDTEGRTAPFHGGH